MTAPHMSQNDSPQLKWDKRFLELAKTYASWSKDPSTQVGAVAVDKDGRVISAGYNGFPRGIADTPQRLNNRELKYRYIVHAEMNAIYNASFAGVSLNGATMYVHGLPCCSECTKGMIQVGIKRIVMAKQNVPEKWKESWYISRRMCEEADIKIDFTCANSGTECTESDWEPINTPRSL